MTFLNIFRTVLLFLTPCERFQNKCMQVKLLNEILSDFLLLSGRTMFSFCSGYSVGIIDYTAQGHFADRHLLHRVFLHPGIP